MGGETLTAPYLNETVLGGKSEPYSLANLLAYLNGDRDNVPSGSKELEGSQNLWKLKAGAKLVAGREDPRLEQMCIDRYVREKEEIGLWGSEQTSPIYHLFMMLGDFCIADNCKSLALNQLAIESFASFLKYAQKMGLEISNQGLVGQRGCTPSAFEGKPYIHYILNYLKDGTPSNYQLVKGYRSFIRENGVVNQLVIGHPLWNEIKELYQDPNFQPWRLRVPTWFMYLNGVHFATVVEKGINGNTPLLGAYVRPINKYLPWNADLHVRQRADHAQLKWDFTNNGLLVTYSGLFCGLERGGDGIMQTYFVPIGSGELVVERHDMMGVTKVTLGGPAIPPQPPVVVEPPKPPKKEKPSWIERMGL